MRALPLVWSFFSKLSCLFPLPFYGIAWGKISEIQRHRQASKRNLWKQEFLGVSLSPPFFWFGDAFIQLVCSWKRSLYYATLHYTLCTSFIVTGAVSESHVISLLDFFGLIAAGQTLTRVTPTSPVLTISSNTRYRKKQYRSLTACRPIHSPYAPTSSAKGTAISPIAGLVSPAQARSHTVPTNSQHQPQTDSFAHQKLCSGRYTSRMSHNTTRAKAGRPSRAQYRLRLAHKPYLASTVNCSRLLAPVYRSHVYGTGLERLAQAAVCSTPAAAAAAVLLSS